MGARTNWLVISIRLDELPEGLRGILPTFAAVISGGWLVEHHPPTGYIGCNPLLAEALDAVRRRHDVTPFDGFYIHIRP